VLRAASASITNLALTSLTISSLSITNVSVASATVSSNLTLSGGTANGVLYLNGSKVATSGSALTFDGASLGMGSPTVYGTRSLNSYTGTTASAIGFSQQISGFGDAFVGANNSGSSVLGMATGTFGQSTPNNIPWTVSAFGSEQMRLTSTGLGIGTSSPAAKLHVSGQTRIADSSSASNYILIGSGANAPRGGNSVMAQTGSMVMGTEAASNLIFITNAAEAGRFDSSGNLGIGTSSPTYKLHLVGKQIIEKSGAGYEAAMLSFATITETGAIYRMGMASGGAFIIGRSDTSTTNLTLDSSGNLGLGVTPSAWATYKAFEFAAGGALWGSANNTVLNANTYFNGTNFIYKATGTASYYQQATGEHRFFTAASGTAGNAISFTKAMTLSGDSDISLLLGTTSAAYATSGRGVFEVNGSSSALIAIKSGDTARGYFAAGSTATELAAVGASQPLLFTTNSGERGRFTSGGYFKASSDGTYLTVGGNYHELRGTAADWTCVSTNTSATTPYGHYIRYISVDPNGTGSQFIQCLGTTTVRAEIRSNGGLANYQSNNVDLSDARTKKDIAPAASMWDKIGALEIVTYKYNDQTHDDVNVGVIAQQVESVEPVWVDADGFGNTPEGEEPLKTVYTKDITFAAIKALQEAMSRIEKLEAEVSALKGA
jgi:hypothetical protein